MPEVVHPARALWWLFEPIHAVTYFAPEGLQAFESAGLRGFWRGYFGGRSAPLGPVDAAPVTAAFFNFAPGMVERALPGVWQLATPQAALDARLAGATAALARVLDTAQPEPIDRAVDLLERAVDGLDCGGRVLAAANAALPRPEGRLARLWHATTVLREHRGDGHVAALVTEGLDGCEALVVRCALDTPRATLQPIRGWTDQEWDAATARLVERGWLHPDGTISPLGRSRHATLEAATDLAASRVWTGFDRKELDELAATLGPLGTRCRAELPSVNPIGLPATG
ncbi:SCO6745 family protein [Kitasatospora sp. LaBMicrA B282]|uniref:SCO6745 family protein n=1 Tax=Kitasatospora sp. LaBMicrA B282 TaxID=3420949 RepID=UPI003D0CCC0A